MKYKTVPIKILRNLLVSNPETGKLLWKKRGHLPRWNGRCAGKPALESITPDGHYRGTVLGKTLLAHRVIWALHYGVWPKDQIDHINQNKTDNRIENLRISSNSDNQKNCKRRIDNSTGATGVYFKKGAIKNQWVAMITSNNTTYFLGNHPTKEAAEAIRKAAEIEHNFSENHGSPK